MAAGAVGEAAQAGAGGDRSGIEALAVVLDREGGLKLQTVAGYVKVIYQKLHVSSRAEAVLAAAERGLT